MKTMFIGPLDNGRPVHRPRAHRAGVWVRLGSAVVGASLITLTFTGCSVADHESLQGSQGAAKTPRNGAAATDFSWFAMPDSAQVETTSVPDGVTAVEVSITGAQGANASENQFQGWGAGVDGTLRVQPGDELETATGLQGAKNQGDKSPGAGGWSLPGYEGGPGGHGKGQSDDGSGGGGASVIQINGKLAVVAGGGGGQGGNNGRFPGLHGGSAGFDQGGEGGVPQDLAFYQPGYGGGPQHQNNDSRGLSVTGSGFGPDAFGAGGGGGGGGRYLGAGGSPGRGTFGAGGGGGSSWVSDAVSQVLAHFDSNGTNAGGGHPGDGFVRLRWVADVTQ